LKESVMKYSIGLILLLVVSPAQAGPFTKKAPARAGANTRVPELLFHVKMDADEKKRAAAADELRDYDAKQFPEIVPILCDVLLNDQSQAVRLEAAQSLGKIRPVSPFAGQVLEQASTKDPVFRVRMQARTSLRLYQLAGYRAGTAPRDAAEFQIHVFNDHNGREKSIRREPALEPRTPQPFPLRPASKQTSPPAETNYLPRPLPAGATLQRVTPPPGRINPEGPTAEPPR
jgi:hypothetical protein